MKKILVVDDEEIQRYTIKTAMEEYTDEYKITCVESGKECLEFLNINPKPDILILDIMMPEMTGWELYDKIKQNENWKNIPIIFLTARTDKIAENSGKFLAEDYIEKPFEVENLKKRIDDIIKNQNK